jgi:Flp pilus assembly pilin Flp
MRLNRKGQTLVEYVLIISLITVIAIGLVKIFGGYLKDSVTKMSCEIIGKEYVEGTSIGSGYCEGDEDKLINY